MTKNHLKRLAAPKSWFLKRKEQKFITRPNPGPHNRTFAMPASMVFKDHIEIAQTTREVRKMLHKNTVNVDHRAIKDVRFPIGYLDVVSIPDHKQYHRVVMNKKGKLHTIQIDEKEGNKKLLRIIGKTTRKGNKTQLNCNDGRNILVTKGDYKVGDTVVFDLEKKEITDSFHLDKGTFIQLLGGKHMGAQGKVEEIKDTLVTISTKEEKVITLKKYAFVLGKNAPVIKVE